MIKTCFFLFSVLWYVIGSNVLPIELNEDNLWKIEEDIWVVFFSYKNQNKHLSKKISDMWQNLADKLHTEETEINIATCQLTPFIAGKYDIRRIPTIKLFTLNTITDLPFVYIENFTLIDMLDWVLHFSGSKEVTQMTYCIVSHNLINGFEIKGPSIKHTTRNSRNTAWERWQTNTDNMLSSVMFELSAKNNWFPTSYSQGPQAGHIKRKGNIEILKALDIRKQNKKQSTEDQCLMDSNVVIMDKNNIGSLTASQDWFILFFGPNCIPCQDAEDKWETFAKKVSEYSLPYKVAKLNVIENPSIAMSFDAIDWPSIKLLKGNLIHQLTFRTHGLDEAIIKYIRATDFYHFKSQDFCKVICPHHSFKRCSDCPVLS